MKTHPGRMGAVAMACVAFAIAVSGCSGTGGGGSNDDRTPQFVLFPAGSANQAGSFIVGVSPQSIEANSSDRVIVVARALDPTGRPLAGIGITFQASFPDVRFLDGTPTTVSPGLPAAEVTADATGTAAVTLQSGGTAGRLVVQAFTSNTNLGLGGVLFLTVTDVGFVSGDLQVIPSEIDLKDPQPGSVVEFVVTGGQPFAAGEPYRILNGQSGIGSATLNFDGRYPARIRYTATGILGGTHVFNVIDAASASVSATVMVMFAEFKILPTKASISSSQSARFAVTGGAPPYSCSAGAGVVEPRTLVPGERLTFRPEGITTKSTVTITCTDTAGGVVEATVDVDVIKVTISPDKASLSSGGTQVFAVSGGIAPYTCEATGGTISNTVIERPGGTTVFTAATVAGPSTGTLVCTDSGGNVASVAIAIESTAPSIIPQAASLGSGQSQAFAITDGQPPYACTASLGSVSPAMVEQRGGTTTYTAPVVGAPATDTLLCTDALGQVATATITIAPPTPTPGPEPTPTPEPVETIVVRANPASIDGVAGGTSLVTATVLDARNQPLPGVTVLFEIVGDPEEPTDTVPSVSPILATTGPDGVATTTLTVPPGTAPQFVVVRGTALGVSGEAQVGITSRTGDDAGPPARVNAALFKANGYGDNNDGTYVTVLSALVTDADGNPVIDGTRVDWTNVTPPGATVFSPTFTNGLPPCDIGPYEDETGLAVVPQPGTALTCLIYPAGYAFDPGSVKVSVPGTTVSIIAPFRFPGPAPSITPTPVPTPSPTPSPTAVPVAAIVVLPDPGTVDGAVGGTSVITATVLDAENRPMSGVTVRFEVESPGSDPSVPRPTISPLLAVTGAAGRATSTLAVPPGSPVQFVVVKATARGVSGATQVAVNVQGGGTGGVPTSLTATLLKAGAFGDNNDGTFVTVLSALVTDAEGNPVADGTRVNWAVTAPPEVSVASPSFTNAEAPCNLDPYEAGTNLAVTRQPGTALTCLVYPSRLGLTSGSVQVSVPGTALVQTATFTFPAPTPTPTP